MNKINLLLLAVISFGNTSGQCRDIRYNFASAKFYTKNDSIIFSVKNYCKKSKYVLYSLEYKDSGEWQEIDNDIFTLAVKGMKLIKLTSMKSQTHNFKIGSIDPIIFKNNKNVNFRIVENLYSEDKVQILQTKGVKYFCVDYK